MIFPKEFIEEIKDRVSASQVVRRSVQLKSRGSEHSGLCPFHSEKSPSFTVNDNKGFFHCFGCGAHGNIFDFLMRSEGLTFPEAVERLALEAGMRLPKADPKIMERLDKESRLISCAEAAAKFFKSQFLTSAGYAAREYLQKRGLSQQVIEEFGLGFAPDVPNMLKNHLLAQKFTESEMIEIGLIKNGYEMFRGRLIFPITNNKGRAIAFGGRILDKGEPKYLNSPETPIFHKRKVLFGKAIARKFIHESGQVIVCEGYMDVISLNQAGFKNAVAPLGTSLTEEHLRELWAMAPEPLLCFDGDGAGIRAATRAANLALPLLTPGKSMNFAELPAGKDPDDIARADPAMFAGLLKNAKVLSQLIYDSEKNLRPIATPEQQADFKLRLEQRAKEIKDANISKNYQDFFKSQLWQEFKNKAPASGAVQASAKVIKLVNIQTDAYRIEQMQLRMLGVLLATPDLLKDTAIEEELANFEISNLEIDNVRQNILHSFASNRLDFTEIISNLPTSFEEPVKKGMLAASGQLAVAVWKKMTEQYYLALAEIENNENDGWEISALQELERARQKINQNNND